MENLRKKLENSVPKAAHGGKPTKKDWRRHRKMIARKLREAKLTKVRIEKKEAEERGFSALTRECKVMDLAYRQAFYLPIAEVAIAPYKPPQPQSAQWAPGGGKVCIYGLADPRDHVIRYVGKTSRHLAARVGEHEFDPSNNAVGEWLKALRLDGVGVEAIVLEVCQKAMWQEREIHWIAQQRKAHKLLNVAKGGRYYAPLKGDKGAKKSHGFHRMVIAKSGPVRHLTKEEIALIYGQSASTAG